ncbi:MAG TPA: SGNH/GDSL hydrolase family protein, partial [Candidatus Saccharimonadales bacterium]|nr:SGNH/GDSL hydrolase family protein [Candidatus Saccharimonadales bacterium]
HNFFKALSRRTILSILSGLLLLMFLAGTSLAADAPFYLKSGDHVCFYGDSITEQRYYGVDVETYVRTRFPDLRVKFVNSGVGGDRVTGGWAGPIDERLQRDVFPFKPNVVTIMLGMNDGGYHAFDQATFRIYTNGYEHIIESLQKHLPGVRLVLIEPTPYDDVTSPPQFPGGYNGVLLRYSDFVRQLAAEHHLMCVDFMTPMLDVLKKMEAKDAGLARDLIPGRIHPSAVGELLMAQALLEAWNAPSVVTTVTINAASNQAVQANNTSISGLAKNGDTISWTQNDRSLPFPILGLHEDWWQFPPVSTFDTWPPKLTFFNPPPQPNWDYTNAAAQMIVDLSGFYDALDQEPLAVRGLQSGNYELKINGQTIGQFSAAQLEQGINLAEYRTPMLLQAYDVLDLVYKEVQWRFYAWRAIQLQLVFNHDRAVQRAANKLIDALYAQMDQIVDQQFDAAKPKPAHYELVRVTQ